MRNVPSRPGPEPGQAQRGIDLHLSRVKLDIKGVEAELVMKARSTTSPRSSIA
jgi:hypothetical protein